MGVAVLLGIVRPSDSQLRETVSALREFIKFVFGGDHVFLRNMECRAKYNSFFHLYFRP